MIGRMGHLMGAFEAVLYQLTMYFIFLFSDFVKLHAMNSCDYDQMVKPLGSSFLDSSVEPLEKGELAS